MGVGGRGVGTVGVSAVGVAVGAIGVTICNNWRCSVARLSVLHVGRVGLILAAEETWLLAGTRGVVVGWAWAEALLLAVMTDKEHLHSCGDKKEESANDGDGKCGCVESACKSEVDGISDVLALATADAIRAKSVVCVRWAAANWGVDVALARVRTVACQNRDRNKSGGEEHVEDKGEEGEECDSAEAARQHDGEDQVENRGAGNTLNSLLPLCDGVVPVGLHGEEVAVDSEDDAGAKEDHNVEEGLE